MRPVAAGFEEVCKKYLEDVKIDNDIKMYYTIYNKKNKYLKEIYRYAISSIYLKMCKKH